MKEQNSLLIRDMEKRAGEFRRNAALESLLQELESILAPLDRDLTAEFDTPAYPPLFLLGNPRSGTSLMMQVLALSNQFVVPSNLLSRFNYAPYIGAKIQLLLCDERYDGYGEMQDFAEPREFSSRLGKTRGALAPNEFYHFWRRFLPAYDIEHLSDEQLESVDIRGLLSSIAAIESVFNRPFASKALMIQYNLDFFFNEIPNALYLYIRRQPEYIMQSIMLAREVFYKDKTTWWSAKPREYPDVSKLDAHEQIAAQVFYTERAIEEGLAAMPEKNKLIIDYEALCAGPSSVLGDIAGKYSGLGVEISSSYSGPKVLQNENVHKMEKAGFDLMLGAYNYLADQ